MSRRPTAPAGILCAAALALAGCATSYEVKVDSLTKPAAEQSISYRIATDGAESPHSLRHREAVGFVKTALSGRGLYEAPRPEQADLVVSLDYGVSTPKLKLEKHSEPVFQTFPGRTYTQTVQVGVDDKGRPIYSTVTTQDPPRTEQVGTREYTLKIITYEKHLHLTARANQPGAEGRPPAEIWVVDASMDGESKDLRKALPVLAAASIASIGKDSQGQRTITLTDDKDGAVAFVKKGM